MKKIISIIICIIFFSLIGCENIDNENIINTFNDKELKVYSSEDSPYADIWIAPEQH